MFSAIVKDKSELIYSEKPQHPTYNTLSKKALKYVYLSVQNNACGDYSGAYFVVLGLQIHDQFGNQICVHTWIHFISTFPITFCYVRESY